jgi:hypothetical protein
MVCLSLSVCLFVYHLRLTVIAGRLCMRATRGHPLLTQRASALSDATARLNAARRDLRRLRRAAVEEQGQGSWS